MNYQEYLKSPRWKKLRRDVIDRDGGKCRVCGSDVDLEVHHRSYENLFNETGSDLTTMCGKCHSLYSAAAEVIKPYRYDREPDDIKVGRIKSRIAALEVAMADTTLDRAVDLCIEKRGLERQLERLASESTAVEKGRGR